MKYIIKNKEYYLHIDKEIFGDGKVKSRTFTKDKRYAYVSALNRKADTEYELSKIDWDKVCCGLVKEDTEIIKLTNKQYEELRQEVMVGR